MIIFHHIPKTAGSSVFEVLKANYSSGQLRQVHGTEDVVRQWFDQTFSRLSSDNQKKILCIAGHHVHHLRPAIHPPPRMFTMFRDPIDWVLSLYYFCLDLPPEDPGNGAAIGRILRSRKWGLGDMYAHILADDILPEERKYLDAFFNGQLRSILHPTICLDELTFRMHGSAVGDRFIDEALNILDEYYVVGITEQFEKSMALFAREFGWHHQKSPRVNVNDQRPRTKDLSSGTIEMIKKTSSLDARLYDHYVQQLAADLP
jgi:hypothetical protein